MERHPRVLIVDDDDITREVVAEALAAEGYDVATANDGETALEVARVFDPDLVLLDMLMPIMGGRAFARAFREQSARPVPIIVVTATFDSATSAAQIGADGFLDKPFSLDQLLALISARVRDEE